jgi:nickel-dependent lactate racemase
VPHATTGFSAGGKTIMPGICGERTIEDTHWSALQYGMKDILGQYDNEVRSVIVSICRKIGLSFIINTILFHSGRIYDLVCGDLKLAHEKGIQRCREVYGVHIPEKADIVVAEAFPTDIDLRQAIKAICSADIICKDGGVVILPAECVEGVSPQFPNFERYGFKDPEELFQQIESGEKEDKLLAYTLVAIGRIIAKRLKVILVSSNIDKKSAENLGFFWSDNLQDAWRLATTLSVGKRTVVLNQAGELLPIV